MNQKMIVIELNEADKYFLDKFSNQDQLPYFKHLLSKGVLIPTTISSWNASAENAWRDISPWIVWPSIYTGKKPNEHGIVGFGQESIPLVGECIWDVLNKQGITTGIMSNLLSHPVRYNDYSLFYIPEALANTPECIPAHLNPIQDFLIYTARNYSENFLTSSFTATKKLFTSVKAGLPLSVALQILIQVPLEILKGKAFQRNRALLQGKLQMALFLKLLTKYRPQFSTLHMNHIAYMQHRYWRAAEPDKFKNELSSLDRFLFKSVDKRKRHDLKFKDAILDAFKVTDQFLGKILPLVTDDTMLVIMSGLGQKPMDPCGEIHNPEIRLANLDKLLLLLDINYVSLLHQMSPDITITFNSCKDATEASKKISNILILDEFPLFQTKQVNNQLFLECFLPKEIWDLNNKIWLSIKETTHHLNFYDFVRVSRVKDQSTAHHKDDGWILLYGNHKPITTKLDSPTIDITNIKPMLINYFN